MCARLAPVGPGPRQRFLARACGAIPREHAEPGHEEVRASKTERGRERLSERARAYRRERGRESERSSARERENNGDGARASEKGRRACVVTRESEGSDYLRGLFFCSAIVHCETTDRPSDRFGGGTPSGGSRSFFHRRRAGVFLQTALSPFEAVTRKRSGGGYRVVIAAPSVTPPACCCPSALLLDATTVRSALDTLAVVA